MSSSVASPGDDFERSHEPGEFYLNTGVGPHPEPLPTGAQYDTELLLSGDRRNVVDEFRYLTVDAIRSRLSTHRITLEVAIENWQHDLNIGSLVRTANAFNVNAFHIVGKKHWNQHGALMTDKYIDVQHHENVESLRQYASRNGRVIVGFENGEGAKLLTETSLPENAIFLFGNEGLGLSQESLGVVDSLVEIPQTGSVRSINASAAGAIAMFEWVRQHAATA